MRRLHRHTDEGFSMVEVIVAIVILGIVASSALWFFINGMQTTSNLDRQQTAVSIATSTMEQTFTYDPRKGATGVSGLVIGRSAADVNAAFADPSIQGIAGLADTYPLSDPAGVTRGGDPKVVSTVTRGNNRDYQVYTLIGACYRPASAVGATQPCTKVNYFPTTEPTTIPVGTVRMLRVIVVVTWKPIGNECHGVGGLCEYDVATLVDPSLDLQWTRVIQPIAKDDAFSFNPGEAGYNLDVLNNDVLGSVRSFPVQTVAPFLNSSGVDGTATANSDGTIAYKPPVGDKAHWVSGIFPFKYQVFDRTGASATATVSISLQPQSADDPGLTATEGIPQTLNVLGNDLGSPVDVVITQQPSSGHVDVSGGTTVTYTPAARGTYTFRYKYSDASGLQSPEATATVDVASLTATPFGLPAPYVTDISQSASWVDLTSKLFGSSPAGTKVVIAGPPTSTSGTNATLRINGSIYTGTFPVTTDKKVEFQAPLKASGDWAFNFTLTAGGYSSGSAKATLTVPVPGPTVIAKDYSAGKVLDNSTQKFSVGQNDTPKDGWSWNTTTGTKITLGDISPNCGIWNYIASDPAHGTLAIDTVNLKHDDPDTRDCTAKYTLSIGNTSSSATIYFTVAKNP